MNGLESNLNFLNVNRITRKKKLMLYFKCRPAFSIKGNKAPLQKKETCT